MSVFESILVATDFHPCSDAALAQALELAECCGAKVHLLHVYTMPGLPDGASLSHQAIDDAEHAARRKLENLARGVERAHHLGRLLVRMGDAATAITLVAAELRAELIVLGTHGRRGVNRLLMGSVANAVVRTAPCSVLVTRDRPLGPSAA